MNLIKHKTVIILLAFVYSLGYAQKGDIRKATKAYDNFSYIKTSKILLEVANEGYKSVDLFQKLGNSFYFNNNMEGASKWYGELMALKETIDPEYYYRYAQSLKHQEDYRESDKWMTKFYALKSEDTRGKAFASKIDYLTKIEDIKNNIEIYNLDINSSVSDFGTTQYKGSILFASSRGDAKIYKWNEQPFLDLYASTKELDGSYKTTRLFDETINTDYHESTATFTSDEKLMFFTRNNYFKRKLKRDGDGITRLKLYRTRALDYGEWSEVESIHFNSDDYSVAHPSINIYGNKLYFASDMPGTLGQSDLYVVDVDKDGVLGTPINLGVYINTEGQETFPFINEQGDLYFSSNGYPGLGGLDVYVIRDFENKYETAQPLVVENIGKPINSPQDDFGYYENIGTQEGFFTSNRLEGKGDDDIYSFKIPECEQLVEGVVKDKSTDALISNSIVTLFDTDGQRIDQVTVGEDAVFSFKLSCDTEFLVRAEKETYTSDEKRFTTPNKKQELKLALFLERDEQEIQVGDDLAKVLHIPIIYFDFDKYHIRYDAEIELQKVLAVMNEYPTMVVDIRSHTDCRATYKYNETLSENRAKSTRQYLIDKGISASRLTAKGYGESQLVNDCACEGEVSVSCSEADHQLNRRSEFIIVKM